jgi:hypothetical protein
VGAVRAVDPLVVGEVALVKFEDAGWLVLQRQRRLGPAVASRKMRHSCSSSLSRSEIRLGR